MSADMDIYLLSENCIFDEITETIVMQIGNISVSLSIDEFIEFSTNLEDAKSSLFNMPSYVIGTFTCPEGDKKITLVRKPDDDDYT